MLDSIDALRNSIIVVCQQEEEPPFNTPDLLAKFALAAIQGGAAAVRVSGIDVVRAVRELTDAPIIGQVDGAYSNGFACVTPDFSDIDALLAAGADAIALDATPRLRPNGMDGVEFFDDVRSRYSVPLIADVSTFVEGIRAAEMGADIIATTLSGYTETTEHRRTDAPDLQLVEELGRALKVPVMAQGRYWNPAQAADAKKRGASIVAVGGPVTRPSAVTRKFLEAIKG